jgi:predicted nucleic acid-binding Zn ribbon protein
MPKEVPEDQIPAPKKRWVRADMDPPLVGQVLEEFATAQGWGDKVAISRLKTEWESVVGPILVSRCEPVRVEAGGMLVIHCDHGATANEVTLLATTILSKAKEVSPKPHLVGITARVRGNRSRAEVEKPGEPGTPNKSG